MDLIIKRSEWFRGKKEYFSESYLFHSATKTKCCLGFLALACGSSIENISDKQVPSDCEINVWPESIMVTYKSNNFKLNTNLTTLLMDINDSNLTTDEQKEKDLTNLFASININTIFID